MVDRAGVEHRRRTGARPRRDKQASWRLLAHACALALVLAACGSSATSPSGTAGPSGSRSHAPGASGTPGAAWAVLGGGPLPDNGAFMIGIAVRDGLVVAAGAVPSSDGDTTTAGIWVSQDGGGWTRAVIEGSRSGFPRGITVTNQGFTIVGWDGCPNAWAYGDTRECSTAVWASPDGSSWERLAEPALPRTVLTAVAPWNGGLIAVGVTDTGTGVSHAVPTGTNEPIPVQGGQPAPAGVVLSSRDGSSWEQLDVGSVLDGAVLMDLAVEDGDLVAAGLQLDSPGSASATPMHAWVSGDGTTWTVEPMTGEQPAFWVSLASAPSGLVASGLNPGFMGSPSYTPAWRRTGGGWTGLGLSAGWESRLFGDVAGGPDGALIAGGDSETGSPLLYASADGEHWMWIPASGSLVDTPITPLAAAWADGRFYLAGAAPGSSGSSVYVMVGSPHLPTAAEVAAAPPEPTPTPQPVSLDSAGTASMALSGVSGYMAHPSGAAHCSSRLGTTALGALSWTDAGALNGRTMYGFVSVPPDARVGDTLELLASLRLGPDEQEFPQWIGSATIAELGGDAMSGRLTFSAVAQTPREGTNEPDPNGPASITGSVTWHCDPWASGSAAPSVAP